MDPLSKTEMLTEKRRKAAQERQREIARLDPPFPFVRRRFDPGFFGRPAVAKLRSS